MTRTGGEQHIERRMYRFTGDVNIGTSKKFVQQCSPVDTDP
ncbi:MAG TPA: hypothetical protein VE076_02720 [Nitrososphaeraceae archaeon]|nr:hypothetical protein [Nitrososphaeraceae archaeon]